MIWSEFFWRDVFPRLDLGKVFEELKPRLSQTGKYYHVLCPRCRQHEAYAFTDKGHIVCNRANNCGGTICGDVLDYIANGPITGETMVSAVTTLAGLAGVPIPDREWTEEEKAAWKAERKKTDAQKVLANNTQATDSGLDYLRKRGIAPDVAILFGIGYIHDINAVPDLTFDALVQMGFGYTDAEGKTKLNTLWNRRVYGPIRQPNGDIIGYWGRAIDDDCDPKSKIIYTAGADLNTCVLFGLHGLRSDYIVVCEGIFDCLRLRSHGIPAVATLGSLNRLNRNRWTDISKAGCRRVILFTDADEAGIKGLSVAVRNACEVDEAPDVYVINPDLYKELGNDPDELIGAIGPQRTKRLIDRHERAWSYRATDLARTANLAIPANLDLYVERCVEIIHQTPATRKEAVSLYFVPRICDIAGCTPTSLHAAERRLDAKRLAKEITTLAIEYDFNAISDAIALHGSESSNRQPDPILTVAEFVPQLDTWLSGFAGRKHLGLTQCALPTLDDRLSGFRGITLLAAKTNVGKTMFLCQSTAAFLVSNPDVCVVFVSIDMPRESITSRIVAHLGGINWEDMAMGSRRFANELEPFTESDLERKRYGLERLKELGERLVVLDTRNCPLMTSQQILLQCARLQEKTGCKRSVIIIDMMDILPIPEAVSMKLRTEIDRQQWQMEEMLKLRDLRNGDPVIPVCEVRKGDRSSSRLNLSSHVTVDDVMGTARKAYGADAILVYNRFNDADLFSYFVPPEDMTGLVLRDEPIEFARNMDTIETRRQIRRIHLVMQDRGWSYGTLTVAKVRDGGRYDTLDLTTWYQRSTFEEGFRDDATRRIITDRTYPPHLELPGMCEAH